MIHPVRILTDKAPPVVACNGLHKRAGVWACADGILRPCIRVDRGVEGKPGAEALLFHEALHVHEYHALGGLLLLLVPVLGWIAWVWWRREQEVRADAFALLATSLTEFQNFLRLHPHPTGRFWRWCYGRSPADREQRTLKRARRYGWDGR